MDTSKIITKIKNELLKEHFIVISVLKINSYYLEAVIDNNLKKYKAKIFFKKKIFNNEIYKLKINREIEVAKSIGLNCQYLIKFFGYFYTKSFLILKYEFKSKGSFSSFFEKYKSKNKGVLKIEFLWIFIKDLMSSINELKKRKIIHFNINLDNIFLNDLNLSLGGYEYCLFEKKQKLEKKENLIYIKNSSYYYKLPPEIYINKIINYSSSLFTLGLTLNNIVFNNNLIDSNINYDKLLNLYNSNKKFDLTHFYNYINNTNNNLKINNKCCFLISNMLYINKSYRINLNQTKIILDSIYEYYELNKNEELYRVNFYHNMNNKNPNIINSNRNIKRPSVSIRISKHKYSIYSNSLSNLNNNKLLLNNNKFKQFIKLKISKFNILNKLKCNGKKFQNFTPIKIKNSIEKFKTLYTFRNIKNKI